MGVLRRCCLAFLVALLPTVTQAGVFNADPPPMPLPDPSALSASVPGSPCTPDTPYEQALWSRFNNYGGACKRIHFRFGPLNIKAGQMDAVIQPVTIEKPAYSGYLVRFKPDLANVDGTIPDITQVHLHHGTWLNAYPSYGSGPFFAAGEEKTIANFPLGYGMHVGATDTWLLLYMVHNQTAVPKVEYVTYDVDFIADSDPVASTITPVKPIWLDVQKNAISSGAPNRSSYPVFNVQRGFGHVDPDTGLHVCSWPAENCARFDSFGQATPQQGKDLNGAVAGADWTVPQGLDGTIVGLGGHLHPGGVRDEVSVVRNGVSKLVFKSEALPWSRTDPSQVGGPRNTWDFSMTVTGAPLDWKLKIKRGDVIRLNAVYDNTDASWYENMGIVVAYVAPTDPVVARAGVDVFDQNVDIQDGVPKMDELVPPGATQPSCTPDLAGHLDTGGKTVYTLCDRGAITHGHLAEASTFGGCPSTGCGVFDDDKAGPATETIVASGFTYTNAGLGAVGTAGIPQVKVNQPLRFVNADTGADVWHTFTLCSESTASWCDGATGLDYPLASGGNGTAGGDPNDFDSAEVGYGAIWSSAKGQVPGSDFPQNTVGDGAYWDFTPSQTGVYQFFCRVHPSMRGVFQVVP